MKFEKHVFICTNERSKDEKKSCGEACGMELVKAFKKALKDHKMKGVMRAQRAGCLDACDYGPAMVVYPEGIYYGGVQLSDVDEIVNEHLIHNRPVQRLVIDFSKKETEKNEIETFRNDNVVLMETAGQVRKDFESCGLEIQFSKNDALTYDDLLVTVKEHVETLVQRQSGAFQNLLYRVDIPEKNFIQLQQTSTDFLHDLSRLILEREFMKVVTRKMYSPEK